MSPITADFDRLSQANRFALVTAVSWIAAASCLGWRSLIAHREFGVPEELPWVFVIVTLPEALAGAIVAATQVEAARDALRQLSQLDSSSSAVSDEQQRLAANRTCGVWLLLLNLLPVIVFFIAVAQRAATQLAVLSS